MSEVQLFEPLILLLLVADVSPDGLLVPADRVHEEPSCPEGLPHKVALALSIDPDQMPFFDLRFLCSASLRNTSPKCRRKALYLELRRHLGEVFRKLALQKESKIEEGHLMPDHVHMLLSIPPKYAVSHVVGYIKGKSAIHLARVYGERKRSFVGQHFWARGFFVNTVGRDEDAIRAYIRNQEKEDQRLEQLNLWR